MASASPGWNGTTPTCPGTGTVLKTWDDHQSGLVDIEEIAGGPDESIFQPEWAPEEHRLRLRPSGWWNLYRFEGGVTSPILAMEADFGVPADFGLTCFGFLSEGGILAAFWEGGVNHLGVIDRDGSLRRLPNDLTGLDFLVTDGGSGPGSSVTGRRHRTRSTSSTSTRASSAWSGPIRCRSSPDYIPSARIITFPTADGEVAHGVYYPPTNPGFEGPDGEKPPLIMKVHGGPTSHVFPWLRPAFLYWTTRGFGLVDVNYRGSTGYGRRFRNLLRDSWGIVDVEDRLAAARYLAAEGEVDGERLIITGGSAGGYTTLASLAFGDAPAAGGSYFGVSDLGLLVDHTHKFESRYLDGLVGTDRAGDETQVTAVFGGPDHGPGHPAPGSRRQGGPAGAGRGDLRRLVCERDPARPPHLRGGGSRVPQGGKHHPQPRVRARLLRESVGILPLTTICLTCRWWSSPLTHDREAVPAFLQGLGSGSGLAATP